MARLATAPVPGPWSEPRAAGEDFRAYFQRGSDALSALIARAAGLPDGEIVGGVIRFPVADGYAFYQVASAKPLTLAHIPLGDGHQIPDAHVRGLRAAEVRDLVERERALFSLLARAKAPSS